MEFERVPGKKAAILVFPIIVALIVIILVSRNGGRGPVVEKITQSATETGTKKKPVLSFSSTTTTQPTTATEEPAAGGLSAKAETPASGCFTVGFRHKKSSGHSDREDCGQHRNFIRWTKPNSKSLCVKVDGTPVAYQKTRDALILPPLAGPDSLITVRYCVGKSSCAEPCVVPRDAFLDHLGAAAPRAAKWDASDAGADVDVTGGLAAELGEDGSATAGSGLALFKDWQESRQAPTCGTSVAARN